MKKCPFTHDPPASRKAKKDGNGLPLDKWRVLRSGEGSEKAEYGEGKSGGERSRGSPLSMKVKERGEEGFEETLGGLLLGPGTAVAGGVGEVGERGNVSSPQWGGSAAGSPPPKDRS